MSNSFEAVNRRFVPPPGQEPTRWTISVARGNEWPGWRWLDRADRLDLSGEAGVIAILLLVLTIPSVTFRRIVYAVRGRSDWDVLVYRGMESDHRPHRAVRHEKCATREAAQSRATELLDAAGKVDWTPLCGVG